MIDIIPKLSCCKICNIFYRVKPSELAKTKYCSRKCQLKDYEGKRAYDLHGQKFNRLTVKDLHHVNERKNRVWICECDCENKTITYATSVELKRAHKKSCGCLKSPGEIEYLEQLKKRLIEGSEKVGECILWKGKKSKFGHGRIGYRKKQFSTHRAAWMAWKGEIPKGKFILHHCDVPHCISIDHLYIGTLKNNSQDMVRRNRYVQNCKKGIECNLTKLNEDQVREIRTLPSQGYTHMKIANKYNVSRTCIQSILYRRNWKHI